MPSRTFLAAHESRQTRRAVIKIGRSSITGRSAEVGPAGAAGLGEAGVQPERAAGGREDLRKRRFRVGRVGDFLPDGVEPCGALFLFPACERVWNSAFRFAGVFSLS